MPRKATPENEAVATYIDKQRWTPLRLVSGPISAAVKANTLSVKKSQVADFVQHLSDLGHPYAVDKIPIRFLFNWFTASLDERPLAKGSAKGKLCALMQVLIIHDLAKPEPLFSEIVRIMQKLAVNAAVSAPSGKANIITTRDPVNELPAHCRPLALLWLITGVRYAGLFNIPSKILWDKSEPLYAPAMLIRSKTAAASHPRIFCMCSISDLAYLCPLCTNHKRAGLDSLHATAQEVMIRLQCSKHSFRRTLVMAFVKCSKYLFQEGIADWYRAAVLQIFGWTAPEYGQDMLEY